METPKVISRTLASRTPADAVKRRESLFQQASEVAFRAVLAISQDNEQQARSAIDELRFLKRLIQNGEPLHSGPEDISSASPLSLQFMRLAYDAIADSDAVIRRWTDQNQLDLVCSIDQTDPNAWQRLIDFSLPDAWSFDTDLFLVFGNPPAALIDTLCLRGQRRILVLANELCKVVVKSGTELLVNNDPTAVTFFIRSLCKPIPKKHAKICMYDRVDESLEEDTQESENKNTLLEDEIHKALMSNWMDSNTIRHFAQHWVEQGVANIPAIVYHENLHSLDGKFRDRPAILIAPGPSLDKNIGLLQQAKGKAVLIAPLQSLRCLYKANIQPDYILVLDATDLTTAPFDCFNDVPDDFLTTLVVGVNCHPNVIRRFQHVYFFSGGGTLDRWVQDIVPEPLICMNCSTVAITGLLMAAHWGCSPITLVGQDLALAGDRRYAEEAQLNNLTVPHLLTLPGYYGGTVQTPAEYFMFHYQFEKIAENIALSSPDTKLFNSTEGGAFIKGFVNKPLQEVLERYVVKLPKQLIGKSSVRDGHIIKHRLDLARGRLKIVFRILENLEQQVRQLVRLSRHSHPQATMLKKLSEKEQVLRKQLMRIEGFTSIYQDDIDQALATAAKAKTLRENLVASQALYQVVADSCQFFRPLVENALVIMDASEKIASTATTFQEDVLLIV